jgi:hypothetical protein
MSSTREVATEFVAKFNNYANPVNALESILRQREQEVRAEERERAAVIAESDDFTHSSGYRCYRGEFIAKKIRCDDTPQEGEQ